MNWAGDVMGLESMNLLRPLKVGPITLPNRVVMGSMHTGLEGHPERFDQLARFYAERAKGLVGLIVRSMTIFRKPYRSNASASLRICQVSLHSWRAMTPIS